MSQPTDSDRAQPGVRRARYLETVRYLEPAQPHVFPAVWERGAPDVAVEIVSDSDSMPADWDAKLAQYQALGVAELVRLDLLSERGPVLRVWDRVDDTLQERVVQGERAPSLVLNLNWVVAPVGSPLPSLGRALRIADDQEVPVLVPTAQEARQAAETRVKQLEALLAERDK